MSEISQGAYAFSVFAIPTLVTAIVVIAVGARVLRRGATRVSRAFAAMSAAVAIWLLCATLAYLASDIGTARLWITVAYAGVAFIPAAVYHFAVEFLTISSRRRVAVWIAWAGGAVSFLLVAATGVIVDGVVRYSWGYYPRYGLPNSIFFLLFFFGFLIAALVELLIARSHAHGVERKRIGSVAIALSVAYIASIDFLPKFGVDVYPFGYLPILAFVVAVAGIVRRYDLAAITPSFAARQIIGTMADPLFVCDADGLVRVANPAAASLLGFEQSEIVGQPLERFLERTESDAKIRTKSGDTIEATTSVAPLINEGETVGSVIIVRDVRAERRAQRDVRDAVALLRTTLDSAFDGIVVTGPDRTVLAYNERFLDMWQFPRDVLNAGGEAAVAWARDQVKNPEEFQRVIESVDGQPEAESFDVIDFNDGRRFERYSVGRAIEGGNSVRVWSFRDVTARFAAEEALRDSEVRYRLLFEQNAAGVCVMDHGGVVTDCNNTFAALLGEQRATLKGRALREFYVRPVEHDELMAMVHDGGNLNSIEVEMRKSDGATRWLLQNLVALGERGHHVVHMTVVDISDRKLAEEQIEFHAYHDVLTNLPNRKLFADRLRQSLTHARRSGRPLAVMFIDIDNFKSINDSLGHTSGDELLLEMSYRLRNCVRDADTVARLGGDEFTVILSELRHPEDAANVAQKVLRSIQVPLSLGGMPIEVTASIGIALFPVDGQDPETLLRNADSAMYRAKESGRNNYQLCTDEMKLRAVDRLSLEARLRQAVSREQLVVLYQPQVNLATGKIVGVEALVRWNDPERGLRLPGDFIPVAEESRLILPIGEWVLRTACRDMNDWLARGVDIGRVSVNLSARQFQQHDLVDTVKKALADSGLPASALELEITETAAMQNAQVSVGIMRELRALGVSIAIDDFGTGYSSLGYLKMFPISAVKIDRGFVSQIPADEGDVAIVSAVVGIARSLRLRVVAEGVETVDQFALLRGQSCDEAQGFYFSVPVTADEIAKITAAASLNAASRPQRVSI